MKIGLGIEIGAVFKGLGAFKDTAKSVDELNPKLSNLGKIKLGITDSFKKLSSQVKLTTKDIEKFNSIKEKMVHILGCEYYLDSFGSPVY